MASSFPQSKRLRNFSTTAQHRSTHLALILLFEVVVIASGCASLNSSNMPSSSAPSQQIAMAASFVPASVGTPYRGAVTVTGGKAPYQFAIIGGTLPPGLAMNAANGSISGTPGALGLYSFTIRVSDQDSTAQAQQGFSIPVDKGAPVPGTVQVNVSPATFTMAPGAQQLFTASVTNAITPKVTWSTTAGVITPGGLFTAPEVPTTIMVTLTATSVVDSASSANSLVTVTPPSQARLTVDANNLPAATEGSAYSASLAASGGTSPYAWSATGGTLPKGIQIASNGSLSGTALATGSFAFTATVQDAAGHTASGNFSVAVTGSNQTGTFDGPAELPRVYMQTLMADTPAPGGSQLVSTSAELEAAIQSANCGDTILLRAGTTFEGAFAFPAKPCDDNHWIVLRTSSPDSLLPQEGTRLTPCYSGVASLPGRPSFSCSSVQNVTAKLAFPGVGGGPIVLTNGANHYRLVGLEITRSTPGAIVYELAFNQSGGTSDHIIYDRVWFHGTAQDETARGLMLVGSTYTAVVDSTFTDFHCVSITGACGDSQAIAGGLGNLPMGPYKIVDNFLEAAGENIIFGGGAATQAPTDVEIRRNHFYKPLLWMRGQPGFVGGRDGHPFIVKNHFELKNGIRILFEANVLENTWGGFTQPGFSILLTPKNQNGHCPLCVVHDITVRYTTISHVGSGIAIGNGASDSGALSQGAWNESLHDIVMDDIDGATYGGQGHFFQEGSGNPHEALNNVSVDHITAIGTDAGAILIVGSPAAYPQMKNFWWTNSIFTTGSGIMSSGGGAANCAYAHGGPLAILNSCFNPYEFNHNVLIGATGNWPAGNHNPASINAVMFANNHKGSVLNYQLQPASPFKNAGSDGKDLGADVSTLSGMIAGVTP